MWLNVNLPKPTWAEIIHKSKLGLFKYFSGALQVPKFARVIIHSQFFQLTTLNSYINYIMANAMLAVKFVPNKFGSSTRAEWLPVHG